MYDPQKVTEITAQRRANGESYKSIARALANNGYVSALGTPYKPGSLSVMVGRDTGKYPRNKKSHGSNTVTQPQTAVTPTSEIDQIAILEDIITSNLSKETKVVLIKSVFRG